MKLEELTEEHLVEIVRLYEEYCGDPQLSFRERMWRPPSEVLEKLREEFPRWGKVERRIGSRWCGQSKLKFGQYTDLLNNCPFEEWFKKIQPKDLVVYFDSNLRDYELGYEEANAAGKEFNKAVMEYLYSMT
ncbi:hypothetical protein HZC30_02195 [Candidatus Woesearchaeota archaeon]|nr:hypothetical protein [Candidatus Woesearchaeota archaeon]